MIDININTLISQALSAAVQQAVDAHLTAIRQEYANKLGEMAERIAALEFQSGDRHDRLRTLEGALTDRVAALENNPAQGDTLSPDDLVQIKQRIAALETAQQPETTLEETLQTLDNQEWFWNKIRNFTDTAVEQAVDEHTENWDHNDFVTEDKLDDYVKSDSVREEIEDIINGATFSIRT